MYLNTSSKYEKLKIAFGLGYLTDNGARLYEYQCINFCIYLKKILRGILNT